MAIKINLPKNFNPALIDTGKLMSSMKAGIKRAFPTPKKAKRKRRVTGNRLKFGGRAWQAKADALGDACCRELDRIRGNR